MLYVIIVKDQEFIFQSEQDARAFAGWMMHFYSVRFVYRALPGAVLVVG